ncbi:ionotropic receptor 21a [Anabrus simplex]|uniref:ionotropic receptor 21a n=1 Tax=Anabrus simplex TaxID=316456 RepID=UPI0035A2F6D5
MVSENEDLLEPNYKTLSVVEKVRHCGCQIYIILISNGWQLSRLLRYGDRHRVLNTRAKFVLLHDARLFRSDLHYLWKKIVNVVFLRRYDNYHKGVKTFGRQKGTSSYEISTVPFPSPIRDILVPFRLDVWHNGKFHSGVDLFREKISDLWKQSLQVVTFQHIPSAIKARNKSNLQGSERIGFGGLEIELLQTIASKMNFKAEIYETENADDEKWGRYGPNGSLTGLLGEVVRGRAEIALGNLHYTPYHLDLMDLSIPYNTECLTFLTPEVLADNSWKTLILPFKPYMWAAVLVTLILGGFIFHALSRFQQWLMTSSSVRGVDGDPTPSVAAGPAMDQPEGLYLFGDLCNGILYTFGMLLLVSLPKVPSGWSLRLLTGWWWLYCVLVVVSYRASMTAILANPASRVTIDTIDQLAESKIACGGWGEQQKIFFETSLDMASKKIGEKFEVIYDSDQAIGRVARGDFAYYGNIHFLRHVRIKRILLTEKFGLDFEAKNDSDSPEEQDGQNANDRSLHIMRECVINMPISIGLQKNSPLKPRLDKFLRRIIESGLVKKWLNDVMLSTTSREPMFMEESNSNALMDLRKFYGGLVGLGMGYFISSCVLFGELLHWRYVVQRSPLFDKYAVNIYHKKKKKPMIKTKQ